MPTPDLSLLVYCRDDSISSRWVGQNALLSELQCDQNIYTLATATQWLLDNYTPTVSLASISQPTPSSILFTKTDDTTDGPFDLPIAVFNDQGDWTIDTPYIVNDTFIAPDGGLYRVLFDHTSSHTSFDPAANDGMGHDFYAAMIPPRGNVFPSGGAIGMYLRKNSTADYDFNAAFIRATEIIFDPSSGSGLTSTTVADAIEELEGLLPTGFDSTAITYTPTAWLTATNVSDALGELANINALNVAFSPTTDTSLISTNVADAIVEVDLLASGALFAANNLSDVANVAAARASLGLDTADNPQFATIELGHASDTTISRSAAGVIAVEGVPLYSNIPQNSKSAAYTTVLADAQKHILHPSADTTARNFTIDSNANVPYPIGTAITFVNQHSAGVITIKITSDTMRLAGAGTTGDRTLAADGIATAIKITSTEWLISGTGLT